jgi:hypothetical protein
LPTNRPVNSSFATMSCSEYGYDVTEVVIHQRDCPCA